MSNKVSSTLLAPGPGTLPERRDSPTSPTNNPSMPPTEEEEDEVKDDLAAMWINFGGEG